MHVAYRLVHSSPIITRYLPCPHARCLSVGTQQSYPHRLLTMSPCTLLIGWYTAVLSSPVTYHVPMHVAYRLVHSSPNLTGYLPCPHARCLSVGTQQSYHHPLLTMSPCTLLIGWYTELSGKGLGWEMYPAWDTWELTVLEEWTLLVSEPDGCWRLKRGEASIKILT